MLIPVARDERDLSEILDYLLGLRASRSPISLYRVTMSMDLIVLRRWFTDRATEGELYLDGQRFCYTLEDVSPWNDRQATKIPGVTAIPPGRYSLQVNLSPRFKERLPLLEQVPGFTGVRIHAGNTPEDTEGCILVGRVRTSPTDGWVGESRAALTELLTRLDGARGSCWCTILEARDRG